MKKSFTLITMAALMTVTNAYAQIVDEPEGTVYDTYAESQSFYPWGSEATEPQAEVNTGYRLQLIDDGNGTVYMKHPFPQQWMTTEEDGYLKLTRQADGTYAMVLPQTLFTTEQGVLTYAHVYNVTATQDENGKDAYSFAPCTTTDRIRFDYADGVLTQKDDLMIALTDADGKWLLFGVWKIRCTSAGTKVELPAGVEPQDYFLKATDDYGYNVNRMVKGAIVGSEFYLAPFADFEDSYIRGTIDGDRVSFPTNQYMGYSEYWERHTYARAATMEEVWDDDAEAWFNIFEDTDAIGFDYDAARGTLTADFNAAFLENGSPDRIAIITALVTPTLTHFVEQAATPANPSLPIYGFAPFDPDYGDSYFIVVVPEEDVDGNFINPSQLYYNIFIDGELFTFDEDDYDVWEPMTDIPATFDNGEDIFAREGGQKVIYFYFEGIESIGVQSYYTACGETRYSQLVTRTMEQYLSYDEDDDEWPDPIITDPVTTGVRSAGTADHGRVVSSIWYTADGQMTAAPVRGLNIRSMKMADGTVKNIKVFVK
ncbi:MAG: hypothetical protein IJV24_07855 [Prevotella sp.]|nr:hypothetical protein [Prevotella sp.]